MKKFNFSKGLVIGLLTMALCLTCFGYVKASADDAVVKPTPVQATYVPGTDSISVAANSIVYVLKQEKGNTIKAGSKCYTAAGTTEDTLTAIGAKSTTKTVYLYICNKEFEEQADNINANLVIKPQAAKKVTVGVDYTKADGTTNNVLTIIATDSNGKEITGLTDANIIWYDAETDAWKPGTQFTGTQLKAALENGGLTLQAKMLGTATPAVRTSKEVKVKISAPGKAPKIKLDVKKDVISLKNGMDFGVATGDSDNPVAPATWYTILPVLKDAKTSEMAKSIVPTANYLPLDKKAKAAKNAATYDSNGAIVSNSTVSYTKYKFKNLMLSTLLEKINQKTAFEAGTDVFVAVRTSATNKKPASEISYITIKGQTKAPIVITADKVAGQKVVASGDFAGKGITGVVVNAYPGTKKDASNNDIPATTGFWKDFVIDENGTGADTNTPSFEFAVVKAADFSSGNIDWSTVAWKKFTDKTKISAKLATKYALVGKSATQVALKAGSIPSGKTINDDETLGAATTYLLIRRAGVKGSTVDACVAASKYIKLCVVKDGKDYKLVSETAVGDEAKKYTVKFYKYMKNPTSDNYGFFEDTKTSYVEGWAKASAAVSNVELPAIENAEYALPDNAPDTTTITAGKIGFTMGSGDTEIIVYIKEYANINITAKYTASGITGDDLTAYNTAIAAYATDRLVVENGAITTPANVATVKVNNVAATSSTKVFVGDVVTIPAATLDGYTFTGTAPTGVTDTDGVYTVTPLNTKEVKATINYTVAKE